jgi:hypothetical protein
MLEIVKMYRDMFHQNTKTHTYLLPYLLPYSRNNSMRISGFHEPSGAQPSNNNMADV